jgi:tryptophan 2,3-dioxygenase
MKTAHAAAPMAATVPVPVPVPLLSPVQTEQERSASGCSATQCGINESGANGYGVSGCSADGYSANEYEDYANLRALLTLQTPRTDAPAELSFLVVTQVMELYFTLLRHEWEHARAAILGGDVRTAVRVLRRGNGVQDALIGGWEALRTLTPAEFDAFRESFGVASGIQSVQYRHIEFLLGARHPNALAVHDRNPDQQAELRAQAQSPSLYDAALQLLHANKFSLPSELLHRDPATEYRGDDRAVAAWRAVYSAEGMNSASSADPASPVEPGSPASPENSASPASPALAELGDALLDTAERHMRWKQRHLLIVWRVMGDKSGSAGTSGAQWLERGVHRKYFPDLWTLRDQVTV